MWNECPCKIGSIVTHVLLLQLHSVGRNTKVGSRECVNISQ